MKRVITKDDRGWKHAHLIKNQDPESLAQVIGIPSDPPDLSQLDWNQIRRDLHNALIDRELFTWADVQKAQTGISSAILDALRHPIVALYRNREQKQIGG